MPGTDCVRVAVRSRPLSSKERAERAKSCLKSPQEGQIVIGRSHAFTYDYVFEETIGQEGVYNACVRDLVQKFFKGFNATILAYGQTGSGKTYTMGTASSHNVAYDSLGIVPRVVESIFSMIQEKVTSDTSKAYEVKVQFLEIYNDNINDLLNSTARTTELQIRETKQGGISVLGATEAIARNPEDMLNCLDRGTAARVTGATAMNATSSRSHAIFSIILKQTSQVEIDDKADVREDTIVSKFHFVDLAGSERLKRTGAVGDRMKEGININQGLLALGNVISALGDEKRKGSHVPFRNSKITRLLQDSLGGNSQTLMIACVSPSDTNFDETLNTLKYANRARNIKNKPIINRDPMAAKIEQMNKRIKELERALVANGGGEFLDNGGGVATEAYEEVTNQLLNAECEVKRLTKNLQTTRQQLSAMKDKVVVAETNQDDLRIKLTGIRSKIKEIKKEGKGEPFAKLLDDLQEDSDSSENESKGDSAGGRSEKDVVMKLRRRVLELETMLMADHSSTVRPIVNANQTNRRISLGGLTAASLDDHDHEYPEEVDVHTQYGSGTLVEERDDGIIVVGLAYGLAYIRDVVTTPFGTGPVMAKLQDLDPNSSTPMGDTKVMQQENETSDSGDSGVFVVVLDGVRTNVPAEVCASHVLPDDDDDDDEGDKGSNPHHPSSAREIEKSRMRLEHLAGLTSEVRTLDEDIEKKELLMKRLVDAQQKARVVEKDFRVKITNLEEELARIRGERDHAVNEINKQGDATDHAKNTLKARYESKLKKLSEDLDKMRRKYKENQKLLRSKAKAAERLKRLQVEIATHKKQRVVLQKKMREASDSHRNWLNSTRRELQRAVREKNKAKLKVSKLQSKLNKQALIIKRREDEKEVLRKRLKVFQVKARQGRRVRGRNLKGGAKKKIGKKAKESVIQKFCSSLEYELGEAVAKSDITQRLNEKITKQRETKEQRLENKRRLHQLEMGTMDYEEALEEADTLKARQQMIENQIVQLRTDLAMWNKKDHPGNLTSDLFKRNPSMGTDDLQEVILQLLTKIVRQEMRSKAQDRALDQLEAKLSEDLPSQAIRHSSIAQPVSTIVRRKVNDSSKRTGKSNAPASNPRGAQTRKPLSNNWISAASLGTKSAAQENSAPSATNIAPRRPTVFDRLTDQATFTGVYKTRIKDRVAKRRDRVRSQQNTTTSNSGPAVTSIPERGPSGAMHVDPHHVAAPVQSEKLTQSGTGLTERHSSTASSSSTSVFDRLTDTSNFTGMHRTKVKEREREKAEYKEHFSRDSGTGAGAFYNGGPEGSVATALTHSQSQGQRNRSRSRSVVEEQKGGHPTTTDASLAKAPAVFSRLTDKSNYTGMYRHREKALQSQHSPRMSTTSLRDRGFSVDASSGKLGGKHQSGPKSGTAAPAISPASSEGLSFSTLSHQFNELADDFNNNLVSTKSTANKPSATTTNSQNARPNSQERDESVRDSMANRQQLVSSSNNDNNITPSRNVPMQAWTSKLKATPMSQPTEVKTASNSRNLREEEVSDSVLMNENLNSTNTAGQEENTSPPSGAEPSSKSEKVSVFDRLTNVSKYTGVYKRRNKGDRLEGKKMGSRTKYGMGSGLSTNGSSNGLATVAATDHASNSKQPSTGPRARIRTSMLEKELHSLVASVSGLEKEPSYTKTSKESRVGSLNVFQRLTASTRMKVSDKNTRSTSPP